MALLEPTRNYTDMLEAFFVQIFNEKTKDALVVRTDIKQTVTVRMVSFKFIHDLLCQWVKSYQTNMIDIFATC
jgi:hypothetical protein